MLIFHALFLEGGEGLSCAKMCLFFFSFVSSVDWRVGLPSDLIACLVIGFVVSGFDTLCSLVNFLVVG